MQFCTKEKTMRVDLESLKKPCSCGKEHTLMVEKIWIEKNAVSHLATIQKNYQNPRILWDENTKKAALPFLEPYIKDYQENAITLPKEDLHATNQAVDRILESLSGNEDLLLAVGAGTIHDLTRYVAAKRKIPFVSIPTAASVDGFVSTVAAMTWDGMKKTMPAVSPKWVLADTRIFKDAPYRLTASGISDLMGKYTALLDWKVSHLVTGEYFCETIYEMEKSALKEVESVLSKIKGRDEESMEKLMYALLLSGLAMQMVGNSRPASGAEHHVSHLWEMAVLAKSPDALHGEKVSVGLFLCLSFYKKIATAITENQCSVVDKRELELPLLQETFGKVGFLEEVLAENTPNPLLQVSLEKLQEKLPQIGILVEELPDTSTLKQRLKEAGCVTEMSELFLPESLKELTLQVCPYVRNRLTLLRLSKLLVL